MELNWYSYRRFDVREYESMLNYGDLSWIVPDKIIACSSPVSVGYSAPHGGARPSELLDTFDECNVRGIIRLNNVLYNAHEFERNDIKVHELEFPDGSNPCNSII